MPDNSICHEIDTGKRYYFANKSWHEAPARGGSGDGEGSSSLPANFPTEGTENANKFAGFDENGLWTAKDAPSGGGGAEKFIVTMTLDQSAGHLVGDKTYGDVVEAVAAGNLVMLSVPLGGDTTTYVQALAAGSGAGLFVINGVMNGAIQTLSGGQNDYVTIPMDG